MAQAAASAAAIARCTAIQIAARDWVIIVPGYGELRYQQAGAATAAVAVADIRCEADESSELDEGV
jgi:hypothetical protein